LRIFYNFVFLSFSMLLLASGSPRRSQLLAALDVEFTVRVKPDIDESFPADLRGGAIAEYLAHRKAAAYDEEIGTGHAVLTADTIVVLGEEVLNKPADDAEAHRMLRQLSGQTHEVFTGVCLRHGPHEWLFHDRTAVTFAALTDAEIQQYVARHRPLDKAGAYGAQDWIGLAAITRLEGSYFTVMGLPTHRVYEVLREAGLV
jgi:septum formation protein